MATPEAVIDSDFEVWEEEQIKLLKDGLRSREEDIIEIAMESLTERLGEEEANDLFWRTVNDLIEEVDFSFV